VLYAATVAFVLFVRRWHVFDRHVAEIYDQRKGLPLAAALVVAAGVTGPGEEFFWRGLFQERLEQSFRPGFAALLTWAGYVAANAFSQSLPILAGAMVSGAVWGGLAAWTGGVLASVACHSVWTGLMVALPPGGPSRRHRRSDRTRA
ncbi:MAG TPA: CPBP family intramembrane glutamic endopeptidase, partial [Actinomycetota bacterium]|nr:CPBP family intramembrane glutamic endopeptidase [Actinomycetota bacterium]